LDRKGTVKILDMGLARIEQSATAESGGERLTQSGQIMGTCDYMAPEQALDTHTVDARADIYSLGCTLYRLLTGKTPYQADSFAKLFLAHLNDPIPSLCEARPDVPADLDAVYRKMMAKRPEDRQQSMAEVIAELERVLGGSGSETSEDSLSSGALSFLKEMTHGATGTRQIVRAKREETFGHEAHPETDTNVRQRMLLNVSRRKPLVALAVVGVALLATVTLAVIITIRSRDGRTTTIEVPEGSQVAISREGHVDVTSPTAGDDELRRSEKRWGLKRPDAGSPDIDAGGFNPAMAGKPRSSPPATPAAPADILPGIIPRPAAIPGIYRWQVETAERRFGVESRWAWSPDGRYVAVATSFSTEIRILDGKTYRTVRILLGNSGGCSRVCWTPDGKRLVTLGADQTCCVWSADGRRLAAIKDVAGSMFMSPDGNHFVYRCLGNMQSGMAVSGIDGTPGPKLEGAVHAAWSPDSKRIAGVQYDGTVTVWNAGGDRELSFAANGYSRWEKVRAYRTIAWRPDGQAVACVAADGKVSLCRIAERDVLALDAHQAVAVAWSPDGRWLASGGSEEAVRLWRPDGSPGPVLKSPSECLGLEFSPDSQKLASAHYNRGGALLWRLDPQPKEVAHWPLYTAQDVHWSPDGRRLIVDNYDNSAAVVLHDDGTMSGLADAVTGNLSAVDWSKDGRQLACNSNHGTPWIIAADGRHLRRLAHRLGTNAGLSAAWHPDSRRVAFAAGSDIRVVDPANSGAAAEQLWRGHAERVRRVAWSPNGQRLASVADDKTVRLWSPEGKTLNVLTGHAARMASVAWSPDGATLASIDSSGEVRLWKADGTPGLTFDANAATEWAGIAFTANGRSLSVTGGGQVALWTPAGKLLHRWPYAANPRDPCWSPDGSQVLLADGTSKKIDLFTQSGEPLPVAEPVRWPARGVCWSPDGRSFAMVDNQGLLHSFDHATGQRAWVAVLFNQQPAVAFGATGEILAGDPAACEKQLVYVVQRTADGPQELWSYKQFQEYLAKAGFDFRHGGQSAKPSAAPGPASLSEAIREVAAKKGAWGQGYKYRHNSDLGGGPPIHGRMLVTRPAPIAGVRSWTLDTFEHADRVCALAFRPDGRQFASASYEGKIVVWDALAAKPVRLLMGHEAVMALAWSPDGKQLASAGGEDNTVRIWDLPAGTIARTIQCRAWPAAVAWSPDGRFLLAGVGYGKEDIGDVRIWDMQSDVAPRTIPDVSFVRYVAWSPDGKFIAAATSRAPLAVRVWRFPSLEPVHTLALKQGAGALAWSPDGRYLAATAGNLLVWDAVTGRPYEGLPPEARQAQPALAWIGRSSRLAFAFGEDGLLAWDCDARRSTTLPQLPLGVSVLTSSPDGLTLVVGRYSGAVWIHRKDLGWRKFDNSMTHGLVPAFSPDGQTLACAADGRGVYLWKLASDQPPQLLDRAEHKPDFCRAPAWSQDGKTLAACFRDSVRFYDIASRKRIATWPDDDHGPLALSPDGRRAVTNADHVTCRDVESGKVVWHSDVGRCGAAWSPDGSRVAAGVEADVAIFDAASGRVLGRLTGCLAKPDVRAARLALAWSASGTLLAVTGKDGLGIVWDVAAGREVCRLELMMDGDYASVLQWIDGDRFLLGAGDGKASLWDAQSGKVLRMYLPSRVNRNDISISPDGRMIAVGADSIIHLQRTIDGARLRSRLFLTDGQTVLVSPEGHYAGPPSVEKELVYVVQTETGQDTLTPEEFGRKYNWKNDPAQALRPIDGSDAK
jgi:WD40 repeat protein